MRQEPEKQPFSESNLDSAEYRDRLKRKLNCLIAVLEVATGKVQKSLAGPDPDVERLTRIQTNLKSTLEVCERARTALERREALPKDLPENLANIVAREESEEGLTAGRPKVALPRGAVVEMSSSAEHEKFEEMGHIARVEITSCDFDELSRRLQS